ncbi:nucleotide-binding protein [candidate division KSB1 bacterium]|nr:nucleotide-binding protein [candidate division KSB1 bacterium]
MEKPTLFIGSSSEGLEVARAIEYQLKDDGEVTIWNEGIFGLGLGTLESLVNAIERFDFAILVLTPDDLVVSRDISIQAPRDNVMFELGLFMGRLGRARTFVVCDGDNKNMRLPSDLAGVTVVKYKANRSDGNLVAALGPACTLIRQAIKNLGLSETRGLHRLQKATTEVEGLSDKVANLVNLLARSRILELDVIRKQFGPLLPSDFLEKVSQDLNDLEEATRKEDDDKSK